MKTILYYFSATGNSLTTARRLAAELGDCELVGLASLKDLAEIPVCADAVGFVYPVYYSDVPQLMRRVIPRMTFAGTPYIFSVCTRKGHHGAVAQRLDVLLREAGQRLSCSRYVPMPGNSRISTPAQNEAMLAEQQEWVKKIAEELRACPVEEPEAAASLPETPVHRASNMRGIAAEAHCIGCGVCERVCPMGNIRLVDGRPQVGEDCISCLSCFHWCPQEAIWMSKAEEPMQRRFKYHHPDVTLQDILRQQQM
jgi:Fe-S-cluster-containing hydrogenase component 2